MGIIGGAEGFSPSSIDVDDEQILARVVDGNVLPGLEEAQLADALGADAAGGEVGHAPDSNSRRTLAISTLGDRIGRPTARTSRTGRAREGEHDVEVVDHEIEDDIDIQGARTEDAEPMHLKKHGAVEQGLDRGDGGVEALQVTDLQDASLGGGQSNEGVGLLEGGGDGLFDEDVDAGTQQLGGNAEVR